MWIVERELLYEWRDSTGKEIKDYTGIIEHKTCSECGYETDEDFKYCPMCGVKGYREREAEGE